jgi:lysophospholipid acyltransferase (LPLAT)-like uncharacterized protein
VPNHGSNGKLPAMSAAPARRARFALLERGVLPAAAPLFRALMASWRIGVDADSPTAVGALAAEPRLVIGLCHGMLLQAVALSRLAPLCERRFVVLLAPSLDGRLLAAFLARFGIGHAVGTSGARGIAGAHAFAQRVAAGEVGVVAVDGPRGPCGVVSPGWLRLAAAADAAPYLAVTSASRGLRFNSWDRAHLPAPFARVSAWVTPLPRPAEQPFERVVALAQAHLDTRMP